jgi:hypothetical protein
MLHLFEPVEASPAAFAKVYILTLSQNYNRGGDDEGQADHDRLKAERQHHEPSAHRRGEHDVLLRTFHPFGWASSTLDRDHAHKTASETTHTSPPT